ncbi:MAG: helix-turn-helix transcriptional regulator, partial [Microthrixaceae bacterium]
AAPPPSSPDGEERAPSGVDHAGVALIAACVPGRATVARARAAGAADGRRDRAERTAAEQVVELLTVGACTAAAPALDRWCSDPVLGAHRAPLTAHLALASADTGTTGAAVALLGSLAPEQVDPAAHAAITGWALAEIELAAARPRRAAKAARAARDAAPVGSPLHDVALVAAAWAAELGVEVGVPAATRPRLGAAADEVRGVELLLARDWAAARTAFLDATQGWAGLLRRSELRCRWGAAEAGRHAGVTTAIDELQQVERIADELGQRSLVARARASLRDAGVRRAPRRGAHPSGLTLREVEVLERVATGLTSGEIGQQLGIARSTVDTLADSARRKLGAKNRRHAALLLDGLR